MNIYILYAYNGFKFDREVKSEEELKNFINELLDLIKYDLEHGYQVGVKVLEVYDNYDYKKEEE